MTRRLWRTGLRCVPLCLLAVVLWREKPWTVRLSAGAPWAVAGTILLNLAAYLPLKAARWRVTLDDPPPFRRIVAAMFEGLLANAALGFGSGDLVRAARLRPPDAPGQLAADYARTWAERGAELLALAVMIFVAALVTDVGGLAVGASGVALAAYAALLGGGRLLVPRFGRWPRAQRALTAALTASTPRRVAAMAALSLLGWASEIVMLLMFQRAFHLALSLPTALLTLVGINAAIAVPTLPGHFGTFEAGATVALVWCGVPREVAVSYAVIYHLTHVVPVAAIATGVYLARSRSERRRYKTTPARMSSGR